MQKFPQFLLYETHKRTMEGRKRPHDANEKRLFHGTDKPTVSKINRNAFNRSYCGKNASAYGQGVYFAVNARYSINDTTRALISKVTSTCIWRAWPWVKSVWVTAP